MCAISKAQMILYGIAYPKAPMDAPIGKWAYQSMVEAFGAKPAPVCIRMMGGTVPTAEIVDALQVPFVIVPLVNADNNQHAANENMRMRTREWATILMAYVLFTA